MTRGIDIEQYPLSNKSYEELRYEAIEKEHASRIVDLNATALSPSSTTSFVNLKNLKELVEVMVGDGEEQAEWIIHRKLLVNDSEFAKCALGGNFKENKEQIIRFPEEHPEVFDLYCKFLYTGLILTFSLELLVQMYTLGDRLQSTKFIDACYEAVTKSTESWSASQIRYCFDNLLSHDRLLKFCISQVGKGILSGRYAFTSASEQELLRDFMPDLMQGVTAAVAEIKRGDTMLNLRQQKEQAPPLDRYPPASPPYSPTTPELPVGATPAPPRPSDTFADRFLTPSAGSGLFGSNSIPAASTASNGYLGYPQSTQPTGFGSTAAQSSTAASGGLFGDSITQAISSSIFHPSVSQTQTFGVRSHPPLHGGPGPLFPSSWTSALQQDTDENEPDEEFPDAPIEPVGPQSLIADRAYQAARNQGPAGPSHPQTPLSRPPLPSDISPTSPSVGATASNGTMKYSFGRSPDLALSENGDRSSSNPFLPTPSSSAPAQPVTAAKEDGQSTTDNDIDAGTKDKGKGKAKEVPFDDAATEAFGRMNLLKALDRGRNAGRKPNATVEDAADEFSGTGVTASSPAAAGTNDSSAADGNEQSVSTAAANMPEQMESAKEILAKFGGRIL